MSERERVLIALVEEVLGPRAGPFEILPEEQNPRDEYVTGVLEPAHAHRPPDDIDADVDEVIEEATSEEDQDSRHVIISGVFSPALDPKAQPRSIGLSFTVEAAGPSPQIEVCATWARYRHHNQGWERQPAFFLTGPIRADQSSRLWEAAEGVRLQLRSKATGPRQWRISLFLVNVIEVAEEQRPDTQDYLFQPQIRVHCSPGTFLVPARTSRGNDQPDPRLNPLAAEDLSLNLLYRDRMALARGHLCGVTWREIDPERPHPAIPSPGKAPFAWTDAVVVPEAERAKFSPADVRTEMVPCYPIEVPQMDWEEHSGPPPALAPEVLAETWQPEQVKSRLLPLVHGYQTWIAGQQQLVNGLPAEQRAVAEEHLEKCRQAASRMKEAIEVLATDEDVRLAFCFANKAIALQSKWARGQVLTWRPFQLAFILLNIPALADPLHPDRRTCDLLWFPTGGGKTEAYLGLAAFTLALRRRRQRVQDGDHSGGGVGVLSRYTLRLLTIQQFRRALGVITACEVLRVHKLDTADGPVGWRPQDCPIEDTFLWGGMRFSAGLWVGGGVTPNNLHSIGPVPGSSGMIFYTGALDILQGAGREYEGPNRTLRRNIQNSRQVEINGEPAQVLTCPCCGATLAIPDEGLGSGRHTLHFVLRGGRTTRPLLNQFQPAEEDFPPVTIDDAKLISHAASGYRTLSLTFTIPEGRNLSARQIDDWWYRTVAPALGNDVVLMSARPARPGYFILTYDNSRNNTKQCDFDIYCPDPECELNQHAWAEQVPLSRDFRRSAREARTGQLPLMGVQSNETTAMLPPTSGMHWQEAPEWTRRGNARRVSNYIPIPALTVDDQVYHRCPSLVIATVDKFARLAFEPKAAALFGNVTHYHSRWGYYREGSPPSAGSNLPERYSPHPREQRLCVPVRRFAPPELILQDELHLIEGPLGSMVGLYETAVDLLCQRRVNAEVVVPKYVASTATVRQAESQVQALFDRRLAQFPPSGINADDRFFARDREAHPLESERPGRLYVAICAPGKGAQTPIVRIWSSLLQNVYEWWRTSETPEKVDPFYTLVGYFNAIRELAGAVSLYRQDIPERIALRAGSADNARSLDRWTELSSRASSLDLPAMLERLKEKAPGAYDAVFATSMFGTGVDVDRLSLMVVHGQPKTTASYIQATGRVGRQVGGLVVTFFRASRPRDLDHYEFFTGYHRALYRYVEPVTVAPFSPRARERGLGPLAVILLRHAIELGGVQVPLEWSIQQRLSGRYYAEAVRMKDHRYDPEVQTIPELLEFRAGQQPPGRRPPDGITARETESELDRWKSLAQKNPDHDGFVYSETAFLRPPERHVVLGDAQHHAHGLDEACENTPQSLRDVEETTTFRS